MAIEVGRANAETQAPETETPAPGRQVRPVSPQLHAPAAEAEARRTPVVTPGAGGDGVGLVPRLRALALRALARMYRPEDQLFVFRVRRTANGLVPEGLSRRYTAIALIGLAEAEQAVATSVLAGHRPWDVCGRLIAHAARAQNLGDVALILWAARAVSYPDRRLAWQRLMELGPEERPYPTVEVAWALAALCVDRSAPVGDLRERLARRLVQSFHQRSSLFPHVVGQSGGDGLRSHVSCFADAVYPVHALARYVELSGDRDALDVALRCARHLCRQQGPDGQWWWHYDARTGAVVEGYPVYAVHQDAMAPMALFALQEATPESNFDGAVARSLSWLVRAPELAGRSLIDDQADIIWRKVGRREPGKLARSLQAVTTRLHPGLRAPGLDRLLPVGAIDYEDRPYHLGWLLHAWSPVRLARWDRVEAAR
jgi:hypothetical protein